MKSSSIFLIDVFAIREKRVVSSERQVDCLYGPVVLALSVAAGAAKGKLPSVSSGCKPILFSDYATVDMVDEAIIGPVVVMHRHATRSFRTSGEKTTNQSSLNKSLPGT